MKQASSLQRTCYFIFEIVELDGNIEPDQYDQSVEGQIKAFLGEHDAADGIFQDCAGEELVSELAKIRSRLPQVWWVLVEERAKSGIKHQKLVNCWPKEKLGIFSKVQGIEIVEPCRLDLKIAAERGKRELLLAARAKNKSGE